MTSPPAPSSMIDEDLCCHHCRYNLRGLDQSGNCPQCGKLIAPSVFEHQFSLNPLGDVDANWLTGIGGAFILLAIASMGVSFANSAANWVHHLYGLLPRDHVHRIGLALFAIPWAFSFVAAWRLGSRDPRRSIPESPLLRWGVRCFATVWLVAPVVINPPFSPWNRHERFILVIAAAPANVFIFWRAARLAVFARRKLLALECVGLSMFCGAATVIQVLMIGPEMIREASAHEIFTASPALANPCPYLAAEVALLIHFLLFGGTVDWYVALLFFASAGLALWSAVALWRVGMTLRKVARAPNRHGPRQPVTAAATAIREDFA